MEKDIKIVVKNNIYLYRLIPLLTLVLVILLAATLSAASESKSRAVDELNRILRTIKERERTLKSFSAEFIQNKKTHLLREPILSEGKIYFDAEGKVLIKTIKPSPVWVLFKKNKLITYYPDILRADEIYLGRNQDFIKKYLGIGQSIEEMNNLYEIRLGSEKIPDFYILNLIPKKDTMAKYVNKIEVKVSKKIWLPKEILFKEKKGDYTSIKLNFIQINKPLPDGIFDIEVPEQNY